MEPAKRKLTRKKKKVGDCYQDSFRFILDYPPTTDSYPKLVHGTVYSMFFGKRIKHAWIELDHRNVIDVASGYFFRLKQWKQIAQPIRLHIYSPDQAREMAIKSGTYGPWEGYLGPLPSTYGYDRKEQERVMKIMNRRR